MIRGLATAAVSVFLFLSVFTVGISWDLSSSLSYSSVENNTVGVALNLVSPQLNAGSQLSSFVPYIRDYCKTNPSPTFNFQGYNVSVQCEGISNKSDSEIVNDTIKSFVTGLYYQNYSCNYWDCFGQSQTPLFLISQKSRDYWSNILKISLAISAALSVALFFLMQKKQNLPFTIGITTVLSSLPVLALQKIISALPKPISEISGIFFSQSWFVFIRLALIGAAIIFVGLVIKLFQAESWLYNLFSKFSKKKSEEAKNQPEKPAQQKSNPDKNIGGIKKSSKKYEN